MKKLKLRIAKFDRLLVIEQLERMGEWKNSEHVKFDGDLFLFDTHIDLQINIDDRSANCIKFDDAERDEYAEKLIEWITDEQFGGSGKLEIGKPCLVRTEKDEEWGRTFLCGQS